MLKLSRKVLEIVKKEPYSKLNNVIVPNMNPLIAEIVILRITKTIFFFC